MSFRKILMVSLLVFCVSGSTLFADWYSLNDSREKSNVQVNVLSSSNEEVTLEVTIPGFEIDHVKVPGKTCVMINIPGASWLMDKGFPVLPKLTSLVRVNDFGAAKIEVVSKEEVELDLHAAILPSKGHLTRDINPNDVPYEFGPVYDENIYYIDRQKQFQIGREFLLRDVRGVRLEVLPVRVNHVTMKMQVIKKAVIRITSEGVGAANMMSTSQTAPTAEFSELYSNAFVNYEAPIGTAANEKNKTLVVVTAAKYESLLGDWLEWKKARGYTVTVKTVDGESADEIKSFFQAQFDAKKFGYAVLVGDVDTVPTLKGKYERAYSDPCYMCLAGDDNYQDAYISRISGNTNEEITVQLDKIIRYEKSAKPGDWFSQGLTIASNEGSIKDYDRANWLINGGGKNQKQPVKAGGLKGAGFGKFFTQYAPNASKRGVAEAIHSGTGIICYIGHGSTTSWATSGFSTWDIKELNNGEMLPVIWSVACVNGKFQIRECFAEAWLRQPNGGAVAVEAASTNEAWVPPCDKQAATVNAYINNSHRTFGALEMAGRLCALEVWGDSDRSQGTQLAEQCNLFGDCTMEVHYPKKSQ